MPVSSFRKVLRDLTIGMGILMLSISNGINCNDMKCDYVNTNDDVDLDTIIAGVIDLARHLHSTIDEYGDHIMKECNIKLPFSILFSPVCYLFNRQVKQQQNWYCPRDISCNTKEMTQHLHTTRSFPWSSGDYSCQYVSQYQPLTYHVPVLQSFQHQVSTMDYRFRQQVRHFESVKLKHDLEVLKNIFNDVLCGMIHAAQKIDKNAGNDEIKDVELKPAKDYTGIETDLQNVSVLQKLADSLDDITRDLYCMQYSGSLNKNAGKGKRNGVKSSKQLNKHLVELLQKVYTV